MVLKHIDQKRNKLGGYMKKDVFCIIKKAVILLFVFLLFIMGIVLLSPKLSNSEYITISKLYKDMRAVDDSIKSDFYVDNVLKIASRNYVLEEMHRDSLLYTVAVNKNALELMDYSKVSRVLKYIRERDLDFDRFVDLDAVIELFDVYEGFFSIYHYDSEDLIQYSKDIDSIVQKELQYIQDFTNKRNITNIIIVFSYIVILTLWCNYDKILISIKKRGSKKE